MYIKNYPPKLLNIFNIGRGKSLALWPYVIIKWCALVCCERLGFVVMEEGGNCADEEGSANDVAECGGDEVGD